jgi:hypothetical protein
VISMSWTIEQTEKNRKDIESLETQVQRAAKNNIIMYCACRDGAWNEKEKGPYPSATDTLKIRRIGSSDPYGHMSKWVNQNSVDYLLPGESLFPGNDKHGSSAATALAAGLAALILWCFKATGESIDEMKTADKMNLLFDKSKETNKYIHIKELLNQASERKRRSGKDRVTAFVEECKSRAKIF